MIKISQVPPDTHHPGGGPLRNVLTRPAPVSAHAGHQPNQPPLLHALQQRGGPLANVFSPPWTLIIWGENPLQNFQRKSLT